MRLGEAILGWSLQLLLGDPSRSDVQAIINGTKTPLDNFLVTVLFPLLRGITIIDMTLTYTE